VSRPSSRRSASHGPSGSSRTSSRPTASHGNGEAELEAPGGAGAGAEGSRIGGGARAAARGAGAPAPRIGGGGRAACVGGAGVGDNAGEEERKEHKTSFTHPWSVGAAVFQEAHKWWDPWQIRVFSAAVPAGSSR
jgi:hypothetical protein